MPASREVVREWAQLPTLPVDADDLSNLWGASGRPQSNDWGAGSVLLAAALTPSAAPGQVIDQAFIQGLTPTTVANLGNTLGW
jgi:hypothetical protein